MPDAPRLYKREDDPDCDFAGATAEPAAVAETFATWKAEITKGRRVARRCRGGDLGREVPFDDGTVAARDVIVHMIEEYARHAGHADLLRECIDGRTDQ